MKTLSRFDKGEDPKILRKDYLKDHMGVGYHGAKMKPAELLFNYQAITPNHMNSS